MWIVTGELYSYVMTLCIIITLFYQAYSCFPLIRRHFTSSTRPGMPDAKRTALEQNITVFAVAWTTEVNELKRNYAQDINFRKKCQANEYYTAIISYLLEVCLTYYILL
jgi:hypothetical protein